jgi:hypothetical protein
MIRRGAWAVVAGAAVLVLLVAVTAPESLLWPAAPPPVGLVGEALWMGRSGEILLQGLLILAGVLAILLLIGPERSGRGPW